MSELHVLLVQGTDSKPGPWHWQQWLAAQLPESGAAVAVAPAGVERLRQVLAEVPAEAELAVVGYRAGADLWLRHAATAEEAAARRADRVLLVAPREPEPVDPLALRAAGGPTRLVVGSGDAEFPIPAATRLAGALRVELDVISDGGGLDTAAGYGPWPAVLSWALYGAVPVADRFEGAVRSAARLHAV